MRKKRSLRSMRRGLFLPLDDAGAVSGLKYLPAALQAPYKVFQSPCKSSHQSIMAMPRGLDHIVHAVRDLDVAADFYRRAGFTVGARNRHSWGTHNHLVQLPGFFMELLTVAEPEKLKGEGFAAFFGVFNREFLAHHQGGLWPRGQLTLRFFLKCFGEQECRILRHGP